MLINFFSDPLLYHVLMPFILLIGAGLFAASVTAFWLLLLKSKSKKFLIIPFLTLIVSTFIVYQAVPYFFSLKYGLRFQVKDLELSAKTAIFPSQKAATYELIAMHYDSEKNITEAVKNYDKAFEYYEQKIKEPEKFNTLFSPGASITYLKAKEYDKVLKLAEKSQWYTFAIEACILQKDYQKALEYTNKQIEIRPSHNTYATRALIYKNLKQEDLAKIDYEKAQQLCLDKKCHPTIQKNIKNKYDNYQNYYQNKKY